LEKREILEMPVENLAMNMLLTTKMEFVLMRDKEYFKENIGRFYPDGLQADQVKAIKKWFQEEGIKKIEVYKTFPFGPFVFLGGLITIAYQGSPFVITAIKIAKVIDVNLGLNLLGTILTK
ncbi:MAG: hypothetical protein KKA19_04135, partial [Candidatus Margulisbacteria bacterium]|nr:hypothetical protein [Candidatus Margulisiibacteriota bacterium]